VLFVINVSTLLSSTPTTDILHIHALTKTVLEMEDSTIFTKVKSELHIEYVSERPVYPVHRLKASALLNPPKYS
jgi:hypothetical protein